MADGKSKNMATMFRDGLFDDARILVTGGGTGLGRVMAEAYLALGAEIHICGRRKGVLDETAEALMKAHGGKVVTHGVDIRVAAAVEEMVEEIWRGSGPLTGLVNNAAGNFISPTKMLSPKGFDAIAGIVFHGSFYVTLACGKRWIGDGLAGSVISILTTWVWNGSPFTVPSAMSKAGLHIMTKSLSAEWAPYRIRLNAIAPGPFPTEGAWARLNPGGAMEAAASGGSEASAYGGNPWGRQGEMVELANLACFLMAPGCDYMTGQCVAIDGGAYVSSGGNFSGLSRIDDEMWVRIRDQIRSVNEKDKASRTV